MEQTGRQALIETIRGLAPETGHPALVHMADVLREQYGSNLAAVLFYGSCLRGGDPHDGLVDLYVIVDRYRDAYGSVLQAFWNRALPPNVFYAEFDFEGRTVRSKYAVVSCRDLLRGTSPGWYHSYLWGRFSQPTAIAWARDQEARSCIEECLAASVVTFLDRVLPSLPAEGTLLSLWTGGLALSYGAELRTEKPERTRELVDHYREYYRQVTTAAAPLLRWPLDIEPPDHYRATIAGRARTLNRIGWKVRSLQGKFLSLARLIKALFTFEGGLDYLAWKLERHSGQPVDIPDRVRRWPLIFIWGLFWRLYRRGIFR